MFDTDLLLVEFISQTVAGPEHNAAGVQLKRHVTATTMFHSFFSQKEKEMGEGTGGLD